jgi:hypothetical protein
VVGGGRRRDRIVVACAAIVVGLVVASCAVIIPDPGPPGSILDGVDLARPRILMRPGDVETVVERLDREPYRTLYRQSYANGRSADGVALDDHSIAAERIKSRAAKELAFQYAVGYTVDGAAVVPFPDAAARQATADRAQQLLLSMYTRSRLEVPPPLGGTDRDINTSEELLQWATAYDTLVGAGHDFGANDLPIRSKLALLAGSLYRDFANPSLASNYTAVLPNNHRSKSAAAIGVAGIALAEYRPLPATDPAHYFDPAKWLEFGIDQVELVEGWLYGSGDGGYGEGPYYQRYAAQNLLPFLRAWDRLTGGRAVEIGGHTIPSLYRHPSSQATQRWMLDMTVPDGSMAPVDDGNPGRTYYFGALAQDSPEAGAFAWRWANAVTPYDSDGSISLAADEILAYDDTAVTPAPPSGSPTAFYPEAGNAIFRSDWGPDAVESIVLGEHGAAAELGRDRDGLGRSASAAHEHPDSGSFMLYAYGERLLLDPGYLTFPTRSLVNKATDHNVVLVDGKGPEDPFLPSILWNSDPAGSPGVDGQATISDTFDTSFLDGARVTARYGEPAARAADVSRRFLFADDRYLVVDDTLDGAGTPASTFTWLLHGNGGGTSGGTFTAAPTGGRWQQGGARVDAAVATDAPDLTFGTTTANHEAYGNVLTTHTALQASATGADVTGLSLLYPTRAADPAPTITTGTGTPQSPLHLVDPTGDRVVDVARDPSGAGTTGVLRLIDTHSDGSLRLAYARNANALSADGVSVTSDHPGDLGVRVSAGTAEVLADTGDATVLVHPGFAVQSVDGACAATPAPGGATLLHLGRNRHVTLRAAPGNGAPAADPGPDVEAAPGDIVTLHGDASCDPDGDALTPSWRLLSAPAGSGWALDGAATWSPTLHADRPGPYRVELVVTDAGGHASDPVETTVWAGTRCAGDRLEWSDPVCRPIAG